MNAQAPAQDQRRVLDVSVLPHDPFGHAGLVWWGTTGFMVIEGSMFVIVLIVYFYLRLQVQNWPPSRENPMLLYGTLNILWVFVSLAPAYVAKKKAEELNLAGVRLWLGLLVLMGVVSLVLRVFEYYSLNCRWDDNAYGSIVWTLLSMHTLHLGTDVADSAVLLTLAFVGPNSKKRFVDYSDNSFYWYFVVAWWVPVYVTIYFMPRWL